MKNKLVYILLISITFLAQFSIQSCTQEDLVAPKTLPINSMYVNLVYFENTVFDNPNKQYVFDIISQWELYVTDSLLLPSKAYQQLISKEALYQAKNTWLRETDFELNLKTYNTKLFNIADEDSSEWKLYITKEGEYTDFLLLNGLSANSDSIGSWTVTKYDIKEISINFLKIDWLVKTNNSQKIQFTNIIPGSIDNGKYILINDSIDDIYNKYIDIYDKSKDNHSYIQLNTNTKTGRIKDIDHFGNETWQYWD